MRSTGCALPFGHKAENTEPAPVTVELDSVVALGRIEPEGDWVEAGQVIAILQGQHCTVLLDTHDTRILDIAERNLHIEDGRLID